MSRNVTHEISTTDNLTPIIIGEEDPRRRITLAPYMFSVFSLQA